MDRILRITVLLVAASFVFEAAYAEIDADLIAGLKARSIGPAGNGGRTTSIDVVESDTDTIYIGAAAGELAVDNTPVTDSNQV